MKSAGYAYAVAYIKTLENKMLSKSDIEALLAASDFSAAMRLLRERGYGTDGAFSAEEITDEELKKAWDAVNGCVLEDGFLKVIKYRNDFQNLKLALKASAAGRDFRPFLRYPALSKADDLESAVHTGDFSCLPRPLSDAARTASKQIKKGNWQSAQIYIDKMAWRAMEEAAGENAFLSEWVCRSIVFADFLIAARATGAGRGFLENALIPSRKISVTRLTAAAEAGKGALCAFIAEAGYSDGAAAMEESMSAFEKWCDNKRTELLRRGRGMFFGIEPIFAFVAAKELEAQNVRLILLGKKNGISEDIIRKGLRDLYV